MIELNYTTAVVELFIVACGAFNTGRLTRSKEDRCPTRGKVCVCDMYDHIVIVSYRQLVYAVMVIAV